MELPTWASFLGVLLGTVILLKAVLGLRNRRTYKLPPGPKQWPIIGNLNLIGELPHRSIYELTQKYGELMQLRFGSFPVVVGSSLDMAKFFLKTHDVVFTDRPKMAAGKYLAYDHHDITWAQYGPYWRQARKMCITELFSVKRIESYEYIRDAEVRAMLRSLHAACGGSDGHAAIVLKNYMYSSSLNVISRMVLGKKYLGSKEAAAAAGTTPEEFTWMLDEVMLLNGVVNIGDYIPWLAGLDLQGYAKRMKKVSKMFDRFLDHVVDEHEQRRLREGKDWVAKDMVDVLLQSVDDPNLEVKFDRHSVKHFTLDLIAGGTDSSSVTTEWAISELLKNPEVMAKATEELDRVIGRGRWATEKDMGSLPYLDAIIKETMRLHPVSPLLTPRVSREDTTVNGYDIPKGTTVFVNIWNITRDPVLWDKPEEFMPERFLGRNSNIELKGQSFELLPFGTGRRMCPGYNLGLKVIALSLSNLLHGFSWSLPDGVTKEKLNMDEIYGLTTPRKFPLKAVVKPKLAAHLYAE